MISSQIECTLRNWASTRSCIAKLWVFGSRVRGDHRPGSDLDVAINVVPIGELHPCEVFLMRCDKWMAELTAATGHFVHLTAWGLEVPMADGPPDSRLVYEQHGRSSGHSEKMDA
jgi:predicted nucleotidyltransferase